MKKLPTLLLLLFVIVSAYGQAVTRHEADSLIQLLENSRPDANRADLFLQLARFHILKPGEYKQDLDSGAAYIEKAKALNVTLKSEEALGFTTLVEAVLLKEKGQRDLAKKMVEQAVGMLSKEKDKSHLAEAYLELSEYYDYNDPKQFQEKINLIEQAAAAFQQSGNKERQGYSLKVLGDLYNIQDQTSKALEKLNLSLEVYKSIHYTQLQGVYVIFSSIYNGRGNYNQALSYALLALQSAENSNDTSMSLCQIHNTIGAVLLLVDEKEKAISHFKTALQIAEKYNDKNSVLLLLANIVGSYNKLGKPEEGLKTMNSIQHRFLVSKNDRNYYNIPLIYLSIYYNLKDNKRANTYAEQLPALVKTCHLDAVSTYHVYYLLTSFYIQSSQFGAARMYIKKIDSLSLQLGDPYIVNQNNYIKFRMDTALGNFKSAVYRLLTYNKTKDSLFNETKSKQIKQLEIDFETQKKEDSLKIKDKSITVLNQQNRLQRSDLERASLVRNVTFGGVALLFVIVGLLYRQYRIKQQTNGVITHKNELLEHLVTEKEWLLKEVHHRVKNNLHTVICLLESQASYLENDALKAIETSQHRIYAMSLIHQKLYQSEDIKTIDMSLYLPEFIQYLKESFGINSQINFLLKIEPLQLSVSQAIPIALILNEAITNSIKYAFPGNKDGTIRIDMYQDAGLIQLTIADNGIGIDASLTNRSSNTSLGLELMKGLSEDINAKIIFKNDHGTRIKMSFKVDPLDNKNSILNTRKEKELLL